MIHVIIEDLPGQFVDFHDGSSTKDVREALVCGFGPGLLKQSGVCVLSVTLAAGTYHYRPTVRADGNSGTKALFLPRVAPSKIASEDVVINQSDTGPYSVCCHDFSLRVTHSLFPTVLPEVSAEVHSFYTGFSDALRSSDLLGYFSQNNMEEPGVTAFLVAETANILNSMSISSKWSENFICMHQAELKEVRGDSDCAVFARFGDNDAEVFNGAKCLYPVAFIEISKHSITPAIKKLTQASMYANGCLRLQKFDKFNFFVPILGIVLSDVDIMCVMYFLTVVNNQWRIAEVHLAQFKFSKCSLMVVMRALHEWSVYARDYVIRMEATDTMPTSVFPVIAQSVLIDSDKGVVYKSFDYRMLKGSISSNDRRLADNYKWSQLKVNFDIQYNNGAEAFALISYNYVEGTHVPTFVCHLLLVLRELCSLHSRDICYGDFKLTNCIFNTDGEGSHCTVLIDFDLARVLGTTRIKYVSTFNHQLAPGDGRRHADAKAGKSMELSHDIYSFWYVCTLFELDTANLADGEVWSAALAFLASGNTSDAQNKFESIEGVSLKPKNGVVIPEISCKGTGSPLKK